MPPAGSPVPLADVLPFLYLNGLCIGRRTGGIIHLPVSLTPTRCARSSFQRLLDCGPIWARLMDKVSRDSTFLRDRLHCVCMFDDFTARLVRILDLEGQRGPRLAHHRADYMLHEPTGKMCLVEINTISAAFGALSTRLGEMMQFLETRHSLSHRIVVSDSLQSFATLIDTAITEHPVPSLRGERRLLMVVQPTERNFADQRLLELALWTLSPAAGADRPIRVIRKTLGEIAREARLDGSGNLLLGEELVPVVYFRAGYGPADYPTQAEWAARELLERSSALNCPCVGVQLAGSKKMQEVLSHREELCKFLPEADADALLQLCTELHSLEECDPNTSGQSVVAAALERVRQAPDDYVLKPQREGGGNLIVGDAMISTLEKGVGLPQYTMMRKIVPPASERVFLRDETEVVCDSIPEIGVFSCFFGEGDRAIVNRSGGHIVRSKASSAVDGGVAAGVAVLDTLELVD